MNGVIHPIGEITMSMHLEGPWLSTTGKRKGKVKFRNADEAKRARELDQQWEQMMKKWGAAQREQRAARSSYVPPKTARRDADAPRIPSLDTGGGIAALAPAKVYTGTKVKGIATMHKSNAVPVFSDEEAIDISKMRRG
jgi:hypothetical protein